MTEPKLDKDGNVIKEEPKGTPPKAETPKPAAGGNPPGEPKPANSNDAAFEKLSTEVETLKRQYTASSEEGLRLKKELDQAKEENAELRKKKSTDASAFDKILEERGLQGAVSTLLEEATAPLKEELKKMRETNADSVYKKFRDNNKAFEADGFADKFAAEYERVKGVFSDPNEALEKSYILAGGKDVELTLKPKTKEEIEAEEKARKAAEEAARNNASGGDGGQEGTVNAKTELDTVESLSAKISELWTKYHALGPQTGHRKGSELLYQIDQLDRKRAMVSQAS